MEQKSNFFPPKTKMVLIHCMKKAGFSKEDLEEKFGWNFSALLWTTSTGTLKGTPIRNPYKDLQKSAFFQLDK